LSVAFKFNLCRYAAAEEEAEAAVAAAVKDVHDAMAAAAAAQKKRARMNDRRSSTAEAMRRGEKAYEVNQGPGYNNNNKTSRDE
jgi:outer membrane protein TolC